MKCPDCGINHKYRHGMKCQCGYRFALDPKADKLTDGKFVAVVRGASSNDTHYFTTNQLYTAFCHKLSRKVTPWIVGGIVVLFAAGVAWSGLQIGLLAFFFAVAGSLMILHGVTAARSGPRSRDEFNRILEKYQTAKGPLEKLLVAPSLHEPPPKWPEPDIYDYGVERVVVVQHDLLVDLLVKNELHSGQRALVISGSGYPAYLVPHAVKLLDEIPDLPVFFLHDATKQGAAWFQAISQSERLPWRDHRLIDLGLYPDDVRRIKRLRPLKPERQDFALVADALPMPLLFSGMVAALEEQTSMGDLLVAAQQGDPHAASSFG